MIVIDSSAVVAILLGEEDAARYMAAIERDDAPLMSAASFVELNAVMKHRKGPGVIAIIDRFLAQAAIAIEPVTERQAWLARDAYMRFGVLNFGDVFAYALAKDKTVPLLFKGEDFRRTDIVPAA